MTTQDTELIEDQADRDRRVPPASLAELFAQRVRLAPRAPAVIADGVLLTSAELDLRANRLAHRLRRLGVRTEDRVAVLLDGSPDVVVAVLAVAKAGGAYVPLDGRAPTGRNALIVAGTGASVVITDRAERAEPLPAGHVVLTGDPSLLDEPGDDPAVAVDAGNLAYVVHTSGSTGTPKGVAVRQCDVAALAADSRFTGGGHERVLLHSLLAFDASTYELWVPLLNGGAVVVAPSADLDVEWLREAVPRHGVTAVWVTAGLFRVLAQETPDCFAGLREVWAGGDVVPAAAVRRVLDANPGLLVVDGYGPTETTTFAASHALAASSAVPETVPIGTALDGMRLHVLDAGLTPVPDGDPGELCVAGAGLARGYWLRPGLTAERFVADPLGPPGERMYRTGDVVRRNARGELEFLGRLDEQVKIRGFRVEPGEVETVLTRHDAVTQSVVVAHEDRRGVTRLVAYVVTRDGRRPDDLTAHLAASLPEYLVPSVVVVLDALPLNSNGKVDRRALPDPPAGPAHETVAPRTDAERAVAGICADVLGVERIGAEDDFFALGGDSILAVQVLARLRAAFGPGISHRAVFDARTPARLAALLTGLPAAVPQPPIGRARTDGDLPLSPAQRRLWFLHELAPDSAEYNTAVGLRFSGPFDPAALRRALDALSARHDSLRLTFDSVDGRPVQRVAAVSEVPLRVVDATATDDLDAVLLADLAVPFDLRRGPLTRATLLRLAADDHLLVLCQHHVVTDGRSVAILTDDLLTLYGGADPRSLPEPPLRFTDHAAWHDPALDAAALRPHLDHWRRVLDGVEPLALPTDRPRPARRTTAGAVHRHVLPAGLVRGLTALAAERGATLFATLTAAVQVLLARLGGQRDVAVGTAASGRDRTELEDLTGFFVNTLVLRSRVDGDQPFTGFLADVRETVVEALAHGHVPFDRVVDEVQPERDPSRTPLVQAVVVLQSPLVRPREVAGARVTEHDLPRPSARFDLVVEFWPGDGTLTVAVEHNTDLFDPGTVEDLARRLEVLLTGIVDDPSRPLAELPLLTPAERSALLDADARTPAASRTVLDLFDEQAALAPAATAVSRGADRLSYAELRERSDVLARHLLRLGLRREDRVGVLLDRSTDLTVAALAVLRAGGAYVPLDVRAPAERLRRVLGTAGATVLLTDDRWRDTARDVHDGPVLTVADARDADLPLPGVDPENLAYVGYTSGSTGAPKGVAVRHADVVALALDRRFAGDAHRRVLLHSPLAFDASTYELWVPLLTGGEVVIAPPGDLDVDVLRRTITERGVTGLWLTAGLFRLVAQEDPECLTGALEVWTGGDVVPAAAVRRVLLACPGLVVVDGYGPTETTTFATSFRLPSASAVPDVVPVGTPLDGVRALVLDDRLDPVPPGALGELHLAGAGLARGYLGRPGATAERFLAVPGGERAYRTGDVVRRRRDGVIEFVGRTDDQVKIRGFRVEPAEVEAALTALDAVAQAVVGVAESAGRKHLVAHVVPAGGAAPDPAALRDSLRRVLPDYLVPSVVVPIAELPLSPNGKVDRRALPEPEFDRPARRGTAPRTERERVLAGIWAQVLGVDGVGVEDNFFELGGDSILSIQVSTRARRAGLAVSTGDLFDHQTVAALAAAVGETTRAVARGPVSGSVPLTPVQHWFFDTHDAWRFDQETTLVLADDVDDTALATALAALVEHHDALRMEFTSVDGRWRQENAPAGTTGTSLLRAETSREDGRRLLRLAVHHLVVDGVSWRVLLEDLEQAYRQAVRGEPVDLGARTTSFREWALRLTEHAAAGGFDDELDHWRGLTGDVELPVDGHGPNTVAAERSVTASLDEAETAALLRDVPAAYRTGVNDVLLAALGRVLGRWCGRDRVVVDLEGHGREDLFDDVDLSRTVGWFTSIFPVSLEVPRDWGAALKSVKEQVRAVPRRGVGHGALRYLTGAAPVISPRISFNHLGRFDPPDGELCTGVHRELSLTADPAEQRPHLLDVVSRVDGGVLAFTWYYAEGVHEESTVAALARDVLTALREIVAHCAEPGAGGRTPSDFPLAGLDQAAVDRLVGDGRAVDDLYPLTPVQAGMVFHDLARGAHRLYVEQMTFVLHGVRDPRLLAEAWRLVVGRTPVLRSRIVWEGVPEPLQLVERDVVVPVEHRDWSHLSAAGAEERLDRLFEEDAARELDLTSAPLTRLVLLRLSDSDVRVLWTFHHVLLDGWSVFHVLSDVFAQHAALAAGREADLPARRPFRDHLARLARQDDRLAEEHWRAELAGLTGPTPLPYDRVPARGHTTSSSDRVAVELDEEASARLHGFAQRNRLTLNTVVQGAWASLLARYSGESEVCFGATTSGRPPELPGVDDVIGIFINTLPVRVRVDGDLGAADWLREVQRTQVESRRFGHVALTRLHDWSDLAPGSALFDSIVVFENYPVGDDVAAAHGLRLSDLRASERTNYALSVVVYPGERLSLVLGHDPALFDRATAQRMAAQLATLLRGVADAPDRPISRVPLLTGAQAHRVLVEWNATGAEVPAAGVPALFEAGARATPEAVAVIAGDVSVTYAELDATANRLAHRLLRLGVRPEDRVAVLVDRSVDLVVAELAVLKAGGAYLPLDLRAPADRLRLLLTGADVAVVITDDAWRTTAENVHTGHVVRVGDAAGEPGTSPGVAAHPDQIAYVIHTSGSTGTPKGVCARHRDVVALAHDHRFRAGAHERVLLHSPQAFDASTYETWVPLLNGGTVVIAPPRELDVVTLRRVIAENGVTAAFLTTGLFRLVAQEAPDCFAGMREVWTGGDAVPAAALRAVLAACPGTTVADVYGPTETTTFATVRLMSAAGDVPDVVPIGGPLDNTRVHVLDADGSPVPPGVPGELHIAGEGVARGYLGQPGLTAERFVADPFGEPGGRTYRTGDVVRWTDDGQLEFVGRVDEQVKVRGFRIELSEVEAALGAHPDLAQAAVLAREDRPGVKRLVAYVVPRSREVTPAELREFLDRTLPDYMVPAAFVTLDRLPLNVNGKLDRTALPAPEPPAPAGAGHVAPGTEREAALAAIWSEVLGVERVGAHDDFFELGGDSILSIQVVSRARQIGLDLLPGDLFTHSTVASLAAAAGTTTETVSRGPVRGEVPLTPVQRWFFATQTADPHRVDQVVRVPLPRPVDERAVRRALAALLEHHDALRMRFERVDGHWRQDNAPVTATDVLGASDVDLARGPLLRATLAGGELRLAAHHLVVDGVSWRVLLEDFATAHEQAARGEAVDLGPRSTSFQEWATRLAEHAAAGRFDDELAHWNAVAGNADVPVDGTGTNTAASTRSVTVRLGREETGALLRDVPAVYRTQVNDVLLTALGRVLRDWTGHDRVLLDLEGHGREDLFDGVDLSRTVGWFTTVFPVSLEVPDDWGTALRAVKEQLRAVPRRGIGYGALRHLTGTAPEIAPRISFNHLGRFDSGSAGLASDDGPETVRAHLLDVVSRVERDELELTWYFADGVHDAGTITALAERTLTALREIVAHCAEPGAGGRTPSDFPLVALDQATVDDLVGDGRDVADVYPLTPLQAGMVFHGLSRGEDRVYFQQVVFDLDGIPDPGVLAAAWQHVVDRTPVLRSGVVWEGVPEPVQVVHRDVTVPITHHDWRGLAEQERDRAWRDVVDRDRATGLDLAEIPLTRLVLARTSDTAVRVLWTFHHVLLDGWSVFQVLSDVFARHAGDELPDRRPFRDHVEWLAGQDETLAEEHWRRVLGDLSAPARLPVDRPAAERHTTRSSRWLTVELDEHDSARLRDAAQRNGLTLNTVLQGAWALLLSRWSGERETCFGTTVSGRPVELPGADDVVGIFINTLPVRVAVDGTRRVAEWLRELQTGQVESRRFGHLPLTRLQAWSGVPAGTGLFDSLVVFENYPIDDEAASEHGLRLHGLDAVETTNYPLSVVASPGRRLSIDVGHDPDLFDPGTADRIARQLTTVLRSVAADPDQRLDDVDLLTDAERHLVLDEWNDTDHPLPDGTVPALFEQQARRTPGAVALVCGDDRLSYAELDERADRLAHRLARLGVGVEDLVGVLVERSIDLVVAELAIVKAGGAYVPLDTRAPRARLERLLAEARPAALVADGTWEELARSLHGTCVLAGDGAEPGGPLPVPHPDNLAYVMYTSGSTGAPKGVCVRHRDVVALAHDRGFRTGAHERVLLHSPQAFDASTYETWVPLLSGGRAVIAPPGELDVRTLAEVIAGNGVTAAFLTTGLFRLVSQEAPECFAGMREVWTGGDAVPAAGLRAVLAACPGTTVADVYGPTETTTFATRLLMSAADEVPEVVPIGTPLDNTRVHVLDRGLRPVPPGVPGELHVAGAGLARGYLGSPGLTADRFVADPFRPGERMYRTGDVVRWNARGELEFVGRVDEQVKVRGFRIEPSEIEAVLATHPGVAQAAVLAREDQPGLKRLVAYLVAEPPGRPAAAELREFLGRSLPDYMVPAAFVTLERLPLTGNGKVDRAALPAPDFGAPIAERVALSTDAERTLAEIWSEVLGVAEVGAGDDFFELGGDSILSIQVVSRARRRGLNLLPRDLFRHPTLTALAANATGPAQAPAEQGPVTGAVPLTPIQHWFFAHHAVPARFDQSVRVELAADVDEAALRAALATVLDHHDALRLRFARTGDGWSQHVAAAEPADVLDVRTGPAGEHPRFDLEHGPLLAAVLHRRDGENPELHLAAHHLVVDGVSWRILLEDLDAAYRGEELGPKTTSFRSWALRLTEHAAAGGFDDELPHWEALPRVAAPPVDRDGVNTIASTRSVSVRLGRATTRALVQDVPEVYRTQINDVLLAALGRVLRTGSGPVLVELEGHGREDLFDDVDLSRTVGWFTSAFPVALDVPGDWGAALKAVKEQVRAVPRRGIGHGALRHLTGAVPEVPAQVGFNYLGRFDWDFAGDGLVRAVRGGLAADVDPSEIRTHALDVVGRIEDDDLELTWYYSRDLHDERTVAALAEGVAGALREIVEHCARPDAGGRTPSDFPLARLDQAAVDRLATRSVEDVYPLTPMQSGMVFHGLSQSGRGLYFEQATFVLDGVPDTSALAGAWQLVVDRTPVLRSSFVWDDVPEPVQVVHRDVVLPVRHLDWTGLPPDARARELQRLLEQDRAAGLDPGRAPLMRVALARLSDTEVQVLWTFHHVLLDGWSVFQVLADLFGAHAGRPLPVRRPFRDYLEWLAGRDRAEAVRFWRDVLDGVEGPTPLPLDRAPAGAHTSCSAEWLPCALDEAASARFTEFVKRHGLTANVVVQGAWALLLAGHSGRGDVVFGATVSGRPAELPDVDEMIGIFINTLPVRVRIDRAARVARWLADLQAAQAEARAFDFVPLAELQTDGESLFDSLVVFENYPVDDEAAAEHGLRVRDLSALETTNFPLTVVASPGRTLSVEIGYDPELFDVATVERLSARLLSLLTALVADGDRRLSELPALPAEEERLVLREWNDTGDEPPSRSLPELFADRVRRRPDATAVVADGLSLTYAGLDRRANRLAHRLIGLGVRAEDRVGLAVDRSAAVVIAQLAVAKAGGVYVPLDARAPAARLRLLLDGIGVVVTDAVRHDDVAVVHTGVLTAVDDPALEDEPEHAPGVAVDGERLAYVMFTSGSTGVPKGVAVRHRDVAALAADRRFRGGGHERVLLHSPQAFDASTYEVWVPLLTGGTIVVAPPEDVDAVVLRRVVDEHGVTGLWLTAGLFRLLAQESPECFSGLREVWTGGDVVPSDAVRRVLRACAGLRVVDGYGPTETTTFATARPVSGVDDLPDVLPIGRPLDGVRVHVLDAHLSPVPIGAAGELHISGAGLARGYWGRPGATAERFVADPFGPPGGRTYRTGDVVRWTPGGELEFLGRTDEQVKVRGFRIELGEVEAALAAHPDVAQAAVVAREDRPGGKTLVAYVVSGSGVDPEALRAFLGRTLPEHSVPSVFVALERLPLSGTGKVDRRALPAPDPGAAPTTGHVAPETDLERAVAGIWEEVLGLRDIGVLDNFFQLGGDSIRSLHIASRAAALFDVRLTPRDVLAARTVAGLAETIEEKIVSELEGFASDEHPGVVESRDG
jgi:amino acid adenylation domain-containing protein/non-ribosomal peptide synthase protein (TIGR01720 family)